MLGGQLGAKMGFDDYEQHLGREEAKSGGFFVSDSKTRAQTIDASSHANTTSKKRRHDQVANDDLSLYEAVRISQAEHRGQVHADGLGAHGQP